MSLQTGPGLDRLNPLQRVFFLSIDLLIGLLPSFLFFIWIERNCSLPFLPIDFHWPWISLLDFSTIVQSIWNLLLVLSFGAIHSGLAQEPIKRGMQSLIPSQALRAIYIGVTGASLLALMGLWQNTGVIVWSLPGDPVRVSLISMGIYWILLLSGFSVLARFDLFEFLGLKQIYLPKCTARVSDTGQSLHRSGIFSKVRHPVYLFTLLAILLTPMMSLDRLLLAGGIGLYLSVAIPIEERKLIKEFGRAYTTYRTQVPALIPIRLNRNKPE